MTLGARAARGGLHLLGGQGTQFLIQVASLVILARLLGKPDFGLYAMALAFTGIAHLLSDIGLSSAAIQARTLSTMQRSNLFWISTAIGLLLMLLTLAVAPLIGIFYRDERVTWIVIGLAPTLLMSAMAAQYRADLMRRLRTARLVIVDVAGALTGLVVAVIAAASGLGAGALVLQQIVSGVIGLLLIAGLAGWIPGLWRRGVPMRPFFAFGFPLFLSQLVTYAASNIDSVLMGRLYGSAMTGLYNRGLQLVRVPMNQMRGPLGRLALSVLSRVQEDDQRFLRLVAQGQRLLGYPILLAAAYLVACAPQLLDVVLGHDWVDASSFVRLIAVAEAVATLASVGGWIYMARGLGRQLLNYSLVAAGVKCVLVLVAASMGAIWIPVALLITSLVLCPVSLLWVGRVAGLRTGELLVSAGRMVVVACFVAAGTWLVAGRIAEIAGSAASLLAGVAMLASMVVACALVPRVRRDYSESFLLLRRALGRTSE